MRYLIMTDIEGVTGITTFPQAENSELGRRMLMNDLQAVLHGIEDGGAEAVVYDMHTDGRNVSLEELNVPVVMGKPINGELYRGVGADFDGLYLVGLHAMQHTPGALLAHSYLIQYDSIVVNGILMGEIGMEAALAGEQGIPLKFVSGDDLGCMEAQRLIPDVVVCPVKYSLGSDQALCLPPETTRRHLREAARRATEAPVETFRLNAPYEIRIQYSDCEYLQRMRRLHPEIFSDPRTVVMRGENLLKTWSEYLNYEKEMIRG